MNLQTRQVLASDIDFAREAHHAAYRDVVERQFGAWVEAEQDAFFAADWSSHTPEIILSDGTPCGYWIVEERGDDIHVRELVVHPRCQSRGIGRLLLGRLQDRARRRGVPIRLGTFTQNRAVALYERLGFQNFDRSDMHFLLEWRPER